MIKNTYSKRDGFRAFFAIRFSEPVQQKIEKIQFVLKNTLPNQYFNWTRPENFHITLQFISKLKRSDVNELIRGLQMDVNQKTPFEIEFEKLDWFPSSSHPIAVALQIKTSNALLNLVNCISQELLRLGYVGTKESFIPHVTLARIKNKIEPIFNITPLNLSLNKLNVTECVLFESRPTSTGSTYIPLYQLSLSN